VAGKRSPQVMEKAFNASFQRVAHRARPVLLGSRGSADRAQAGILARWEVSPGLSPPVTNDERPDRVRNR
jgi:hypothetical protein